MSSGIGATVINRAAHSHAAHNCDTHSQGCACAHSCTCAKDIDIEKEIQHCQLNLRKLHKNEMTAWLSIASIAQQQQQQPFYEKEIKYSPKRLDEFHQHPTAFRCKI
ncbi:hypothetical protein T01_4324 [Trichinella spiralis]|uniref:Uncharacterized protein n=1 Tax=Trichinella spiralis TaxID=6334 RepID=A0A0V1C3U5_TRISP|nr:hypothetical protein T01_4324 [Trichinella spiralis]